MNAESSSSGQSLEGRLQAVDIPIQVGAVNPETGQLFIFRRLREGKAPICAIWFASEEPSEQEVDLIVGFARARAKEYPGATEGLYAEGANTIFLKKEDGIWTFRRYAWTREEPWFKNAMPLEELFNNL